MKDYLHRLSRDLRIVGMGNYFESLLKKRKASRKEIAKINKIPYRSLMNYLRNTRAMPLKVAFLIIHSLSKSKDDEKNLISGLNKNVSLIKSTASNSQPIVLPKIFSEELAYLIGVIHDGTVFANQSKNQYLIQYWQFSDKYLLDIITNKLEKVFMCKPRKYKQYVQLSNKVAYEFFAEVINIPQHQTDWNSFLANIPKKFQLNAIAGMFDAEGWIGNKSDLRLKFSQKNKLKLIEVKNTLSLHGIESGEVIQENDGHALWLCGENCINFATKIKNFCEHRIKRQKIENLIA